MLKHNYTNLRNTKITFEEMIAMFGREDTVYKKKTHLKPPINVILKWMAFGTFIPSTL